MTYPTKDKKYVCQTGQFEGFFVESVEFCKLKIPAGPQGPARSRWPNKFYKYLSCNWPIGVLLVKLQVEHFPLHSVTLVISY